ncbi:hypothetical protein QQF64_023963, partial [Cirrhinus molitorella]
LIEESKELKDKEEKEQNDKDHDFKIGEKYTQAKKETIRPGGFGRRCTLQTEFINCLGQDAYELNITVEVPLLLDSSNGYTVDFSVYTGKNNFPTEHGLSYDAVTSLMDHTFLGSGYRRLCAEEGEITPV